MLMQSFVFSFSNNSWVLLFPLCLMAGDAITGFIKGWIDRKLNSKIMRVGLGKKFCEVLLIILVLIAFIAINIPFSIVTATSIYVSITETLSIIENLDSIGVPIPKIIRDAISEAKERGE